MWAFSPEQQQWTLLSQEGEPDKNMWSYSPEQNQQTLLSQEGRRPGKRWEHVMFRKGNDSFLGFGFDGSKILKDIYKYLNNNVL